MLEIEKLSGCYAVRRLNEADLGQILRLCRANTQYYEFCGAEPSEAQIRNDLRITPPGVALSDKYYVGFFDGEMLVAAADLIDGYPTPEIAFLGFFMMNRRMQGQGIGSAIVAELAAYLKRVGKTAIRLGIDKENPQSTHFWKKNGFHILEEIERKEWTILLAEKKL